MRKKEFSSSLNLLVKASAIVFIGVAISKILGYVYRIIIARYYGPEVYGLFSLALMISGWFIAVSALGFSEGLIRFISFYRGKKDGKKIKYLFKFGVATLIITSISAGIILFFLSNWISSAFFHNAALAIYLKIFSVIVPVTVLCYPFLAALRAHEEIGWYSFIYNVAQNVIKVSFLALFAIIGLGSRGVSFSYLAGIFGMLVISYWVCKYKIPHIFNLSKLPKHEKSLLRKELLIYSVPILLYGIVSLIFYWIDSFSIGYYKGAVEVGLYNAAVPIATLLAVAPELFMQLFFPLITKEYSRKNMKLIEQLSKQVAKWILLVDIPLFVMMLVFPGAVINILFGAKYLAAENALRILSISALMNSVLVVTNQLTFMSGRSNIILFNIAITSAINFVLNSIFVPMQKIWFIENSLGMNGAALATLISMIIFNILFLAEVYYFLKIIPLRRKMLNLFVIAIIPAVLLVYLRTLITSNSIIVLAVLGAGFVLVYALLILLSGALDENDWEVIKNIARKIKSNFLQIKIS